MEEIILRPGSKELPEVQRLYEEAFPENERFSFSMMIKNESGHYETFGFYKDGAFCGFAIVLNSLDISHIIYFATLPCFLFFIVTHFASFAELITYSKCHCRIPIGVLRKRALNHIRIR